MGTSATLDWQRELANEPETIEQMTRPRTSEPSAYWTFAKIADAVAESIELRWPELDPPVREAAALMVEMTFQKPPLFEFMKRTFYVAWAYRKDPEAVSSYFGSMQRARSAILRAIEREHSDYDATLCNAIEEAVSGGDRPRMTAAEASARLRSLRP